MQKRDSRLRGWWTKHRGSISGLFSMSGSHIFWVTCWLVACWLLTFWLTGFHLFYMLTSHILTIYMLTSQIKATYYCWWKRCKSATQCSKVDEWRMKAASLGWYIICESWIECIILIKRILMQISMSAVWMQHPWQQSKYIIGMYIYLIFIYWEYFIEGYII